MEGGGAGCSVQNECDDNPVAIPIFQQLPGERQLSDRNNPAMESGSVYPSMKEFRLAMRQYVIDKEFELDIEATYKMFTDNMQGWSRKDGIMWLLQFLMMFMTVRPVVGGGLPHHQAIGLPIEPSPY
jgi:hypothetical protein